MLTKFFQFVASTLLTVALAVAYGAAIVLLVGMETAFIYMAGGFEIPWPTDASQIGIAVLAVSAVVLVARTVFGVWKVVEFAPVVVPASIIVFIIALAAVTAGAMSALGVILLLGLAVRALKKDAPQAA